MFDRIINFVVNVAKEYFPAIAFREGTGAYDLFVKGFALLYNRIYSTLTAIRRESDIRYYATMSETGLDRIGNLWFLTRSTGDFSSGRVRIYFNDAVAIRIPIGFSVSSSTGLRFETREDYVFSQSSIANNVDGNRYYCDIVVYASAKGSEYNLAAHSITDIYSPFYAPWTRVDNLYAFTGGAVHEDNTEFFGRIVESVNTRELLITEGSVKTSLYENFPTFKNITVIGYGDDEMDRDIVFGVISTGGYSPYHKNDFYGKRSGNPYSNKSEALAHSCTTYAPDPSVLTSDGIELDDDEYHQIASYDVVYCTKQASEIVNEDWDISGFDFPSEWIASDSGLQFGRRAYGNSAYIGGGNLIMGATDEPMIAI